MSRKAWKKKFSFFLFEKRNLDEAAAIHATSQHEALDLAALGYGHKTNVIPLGIDLPAMPRRSYPSKGSLRLLYLSRLHPGKGVQLLLQALEVLKAEFTGIELVVAGDGEPEYRAELEREVQRLHLTPCVQFVGLLEGKSKDQALAEADLFVLPSYHESFGLAVVEAMAWGLPVIITDAVALEEDVRAADAGLVSPVGSSQALAAAIRELGDPVKRRKKSDNARRLVEARFTKQRLAESLLAFYEKLIEPYE
jgi:glycosyltransferase involved in cell wall biosynthesis